MIALTAKMCLFYFEMTPLPVTYTQLYNAAYTPGPKASHVAESEKNMRIISAQTNGANCGNVLRRSCTPTGFLLPNTQQQE